MICPTDNTNYPCLQLSGNTMREVSFHSEEYVKGKDDYLQQPQRPVQETASWSLGLPKYSDRISLAFSRQTCLLARTSNNSLDEPTSAISQGLSNQIKISNRRLTSLPPIGSNILLMRPRFKPTEFHEPSLLRNVIHRYH